MRSIIVDTSALYALADRSDVNHVRAAAFFRQQAGAARWVVSNHVFDEIMTLVKARLGVQAAIQLGLRLRTSRLMEFVVLSTADEQVVWRVFMQHQDKAWSYTDCACLMLARREETREAFSFDHHFVQMGLQVVPGQVRA